MKKIVTIFERYQRVHQYKDVGQVIAEFSNDPNWIGEIWACGEYANIKLKKIFFLSINLHVLLLIAKNAKNINVLYLYHLRYYTMIYSYVYKFFNPNGFVCVKGDFDFNEVKKRGLVYSGFKPFVFIVRLLRSSVDLVTTEHKKLCSYIEEYGFKSYYLPNSPSAIFMESV
ncbi:MAG: hypothetical protein P1U70_17645, partial [Saprospiraceae bacterium]|nr:hypothetical protein [Saprospiraceae bacterium]